MFWFWFWVLVAVGGIVGLSVLIGNALNNRGRQRRAPQRDDVNALRASGALRHRKSNN